MSLEARRRLVSPALSRARIRGHAQRLDLPDHLSVNLTDHGFDPDLHAAGQPARSFATARRLLLHEPAPGAFLLRVIPGG